MKFKIKHKTHYQYMEKVFLEPHIIRLTPRPDPHIRVISKAVKITPEPSGVDEILENDGTPAMLGWFKGMTGFLDIEVKTEIELIPFNPFNFLIYPSSCLRLPLTYPGEWPGLLTSYLYNGDEMPEIKTFALQLAEKSDYETVTFLSNLSQLIYDEFQYEKREEGMAYLPVDTLRQKRGACRDFVMLAMAACRELGLACRYVSGYFLSEEGDEEDDLHAWFEVFLPGAGWKGFDPSHGMACDHHHVALSASAYPAQTMPVNGTFRGYSSSRMTVELSIQKA